MSIDLKKKQADPLEDSECETPKAHANVNHNFKEVSSILIKAGAK